LVQNIVVLLRCKLLPTNLLGDTIKILAANFGVVSSVSADDFKETLAKVVMHNGSPTLFQLYFAWPVWWPSTKPDNTAPVNTIFTTDGTGNQGLTSLVFDGFTPNRWV
jgi:hypothetical protein